MNDDHKNCTGVAAKRRGVSVMAHQATGASLVSANPKISSTASLKSLHAQTGVKTTRQTANRSKANAEAESVTRMSERFHVLPSYLNKLAEDSPGSVTNLQAR